VQYDVIPEDRRSSAAGGPEESVDGVSQAEKPRVELRTPNQGGDKPVWPYICKRILLMVPTLVGAALVVFFLMNVMPGDNALLVLRGEVGSDTNIQEVERLREKLGLNRPLYERRLAWLWGTARLDFGTSLRSGSPVLNEVWTRLPLTLEVAFLAMLASTLSAMLLGMLAAI
jgi:peptide/nickel transport system permease protein